MSHGIEDSAASINFNAVPMRPEKALLLKGSTGGEERPRMTRKRKLYVRELREGCGRDAFLEAWRRLLRGFSIADVPIQW